jgi:GT2 family glycosyltransferase
MRAIGGFNTTFWPGEDTKFCDDIVTKTGKRIVYAPDVLVYHHRRTLFRQHLKQVANYALHRGYFVKRYPRTSLKPAYFVPSAFVLGVAAGAALPWMSAWMRSVYAVVAGIYAAAVLVTAAAQPRRLAAPVAAGIVLTHLTYGIYFLRGLFSGRLRDSERKVLE